MTHKKMKLFTFTFTFLLFTTSCFATIFQVGSAKTYGTPYALYLSGHVQSGDTIEIDPEFYSGLGSLAVWQKDNLLIRGVGGRPHLEADGEYIWGKGIWVLAGNNITVENIKFSGASVPDQNGAGIRLDGVGLTVRHCYFYNNENGILTSNPYEGDILIEFSEFDNNGYGDGFSHNLYIGHVNSLTFRFNYSHHAYIGHNLKSRANENFILYNRIMDEESGESSRLVDLSNGGFSIVMGNLFMQGNNAQNNNLVGYGLEGLTNTLNELYYINNTAVNKRAASCIFLDINEGTSTAKVINNIFAGTGTVVNGPTTTMSNNIVESNIENLLFTDEQNFDYHFETTSPAVNAGIFIDSVNGFSLVPAFTYVHPADFKDRGIVLDIDAGAIEAEVLHSVKTEDKGDILVFPNPAKERIFINTYEPIEKIEIIDGLGRISMAIDDGEVINISRLDAGVYYVKVHFQNGDSGVEKFIKN